MRSSTKQSPPEASAPVSVHRYLNELFLGRSYSHFTEVPDQVTACKRQENTDADRNDVEATECVLGVDEAGRGPVIGPMVYGVFYLPKNLQEQLLSTKYHFDDSKVLTPAVRANLMEKLCDPETDLWQACGWAMKSLSARDIGAGIMKHGGSYNLNAQAMNATIELIRGVLDMGVNVTEIYIDTIGPPAAYQRKLERIFPTISITVAAKADSLYPCVSAASVVAKVTRDYSCEALQSQQPVFDSVAGGNEGWGSGYPSDERCVNWLNATMEPMFWWGVEARFSWGTIEKLSETKGSKIVTTDWQKDKPDDNSKLSRFFISDGSLTSKTESDELRTWYSQEAGMITFP